MESIVIQRLRKVIELKRLSVTALGKLIGIHPSTLNRQFNGESAMTLSTLEAFLQHFKEVNTEWLLRGNGNMMKGNNLTETTNNEFVVYADENGFLKLKR